MDDLPKIDIRRLRRDSYLDGDRRWLGWRIDGELIASVLITASSQAVDIVGEALGRELATTVELDYVELTFGRRPYFRCPRCDERVSLLFLGDAVCRHCTGYRYLSESLGAAGRLQDRRERARLALGLDENGHAERPRGMHRETWLRLWGRYWAAEDAVAESLSAA